MALFEYKISKNGDRRICIDTASIVAITSDKDSDGADFTLIEYGNAFAIVYHPYEYVLGDWRRSRNEYRNL